MSGIFWFLMGVMCTISFFIIRKKRNYKKNYENPYLEILGYIKGNKLKFEKRLGDVVYLKGYKKLDVIYNLRRKQISVFDGDECILVPVKEVQNIVDEIITELEAKFYREMYKDILVINGITYSNNIVENTFPQNSKPIKVDGNRTEPMVEFVIEDEEEEEVLKLDEILAKIKQSGFDSLDDEEKQFINDNSNWNW